MHGSVSRCWVFHEFFELSLILRAEDRSAQHCSNVSPGRFDLKKRSPFEKGGYIGAAKQDYEPK